MLLLDPREERSRPLADSATMAAADEGLQEVGNASNLQCRTKLMSQGWYFPKQTGDAIRAQFIGSIDLQLAQNQGLVFLADDHQCHHTQRLDASGLMCKSNYANSARSLIPKSPTQVPKYAKGCLTC